MDFTSQTIGRCLGSFHFPPKDFINSAPEPIEKIEKVKPIKVTELEEENAKKFVEDEKIEILEL